MKRLHFVTIEKFLVPFNQLRPRHKARRIDKEEKKNFNAAAMTDNSFKVVSIRKLKNNLHQVMLRVMSTETRQFKKLG